MDQNENNEQTAIWDLPIRLFHGLLAVLIVLQFLTGEFEWLSMSWHFWFGYATLSLILFRILWGVFGSDTARFSSFIYRPKIAVEYALSLFSKSKKIFYGHNPLGGLAVLAMLLSLLFQSISGLFSADDIGEAGPFAGLVSERSVKWMTHLHHLNRNVLIGLIVLHLAAVLFHFVVLRRNLITPMITGQTPYYTGPPARFVKSLRALWFLIFSICLVVAVVFFGAQASG